MSEIPILRDNSDFSTISDLCENNHLGDSHKYLQCITCFEVCGVQLLEKGKKEEPYKEFSEM